LGRGSRFTVRLPVRLALPADEPAPGAGETAVAAAASRDVA